MKKTFMLLLMLGGVFSAAFGQDKTKPTHIAKMKLMAKTPSISSKRAAFLPAKTKPVEMQDGRSRVSKAIIVPGKDVQSEDDYFVRYRNPLEQKNRAPETKMVYDTYTSESMPSDPAIAVGRDQVLVVFNTGFMVFDKQGKPLTDQIAPSPAIFPHAGICDLTASYDSAADRWIISLLTNANAGAQIAISDGPDLMNCNWYTYEILEVEDYQKLSVWSDGYYMTGNNNGDKKVWVLEREKMLQGSSQAQIVGFDLPDLKQNGFYCPQVLNVSNDKMPAKGNAPIVYMQDDGWYGVENDHIKVWHCNVNWKDPSKSTMSTPDEIKLKPFVSVFDNGYLQNLPQPDDGSDLDALQCTIMNQAQFRKFGDHNSAIFHFVVNTSATEKRAGIRWVELRQDNDGDQWSLYQEGTYTAPDGKHAWHGSMMMDCTGNITLGYTAMSGPTTSKTVHVSSYFTGRYANDPLGTMTVEEKLIASGTEDIPGIKGRYGDYCKIDIDPEDDKTFYFINEYMKNGDRKGVVGVYEIKSNAADDIGVSEIIEPKDGKLTSSERVTVRVYNFGSKPASYFKVSYQIDDNPPVQESFYETLAPNSYTDYTFKTTVNMSEVGKTYNVTGFTTYTADKDDSNNKLTSVVTNLLSTDIGVFKLVAPESTPNLTGAETIKVKLKNFGSEPQSNFDVTYNLDGKEVTEKYYDAIPGNTIVEFAFNQKGDFSSKGKHKLAISTNLPTDKNKTNDLLNADVINKCVPQSNCDQSDKITLFILGDIDNKTNCSKNGYGDFTDMQTDLKAGNIYPLTIEVGYKSDHIQVWIDFNDDSLFSDDEIVVKDYLPSENGGLKGTTDLVVPASALSGEHLLRVRGVPFGNFGDACEDVKFGETEDYKVVVEGTSLSVEGQMIKNSDFVVRDFANKTFELEMSNLDYDGLINITVYDIEGKRHVYHNLLKEDGKYIYPLDMSYMPQGVYLVRMGSRDFGRIQKIIVK